MPDYKNSKIYKIVCNITGETYYGSTTARLSTRLSGHVYNVNVGRSCCKSKQIIERGNYSIILCEECPCDNKEQLRAIERKWIETNNCVNKIIPTRTTHEYYEDNKEQKLLYQKEYREANKEQMRDYQREYMKNVRRIYKEYKSKELELHK
jgi:hypothetical protein